jgi:hypothetical protein
MEITKLLIKIFTLALVFTAHALAEERTYSEWTYKSTNEFSLAVTKNKTNAEFGMMCQDKCIFYINSGVQCTANKKYLVMMVTNKVSTSMDMKCISQAGGYFQVLDKFMTIFNESMNSSSVGFVSALDNGSISVSMFGLDGASSAINDAYKEAVRIKKRKSSAK